MSLAGGDGLDELARWAASERVNDAARSRAEQRRHNTAEASEATVATLLAHLAEAARPVLLDTIGGNRIRGRVLAAGPDFCIIAAANGPAMAPTSAIAAVSEAPGAGASWDRSAAEASFNVETPGAAFSETLAALAAERPLVQIAAGSRTWRGRLTSVGSDVVSVTPEPNSADAATSHIAVTAIDHLAILDR